MPYTYNIDSERGLVILRPYGRFTENQFITLSQAFYEDPDREPGFDHLWDARAIDELVMDVTVIRMYRAFLDEYGDQAGDGRIAVIADRGTTEILARMLLSFREARTDQAQEIFNDPDEATEWLGVPPGVLSSVHVDRRTEP